MLGLFPVSGDTVSGEGGPGPTDLGVSGAAQLGSITAALTLAISGLGATVSQGSLGLGIGLASLTATGSIQPPAPAITAPFSGGGVFTPAAASWNLGLGTTATGYFGFKFSTGVNTPRVSHLGRFRFDSNSRSHAIYLFRYVDGSGGDILVGSTTVDLSSGPDFDIVYGRLDVPVTLASGATYYVISEEHSGQDYFEQDHSLTYDTQLVSFSSDIGTLGGSVSSTSLGSVNDHLAAPYTYGPLNFKVVTGGEASVEATASPGTTAAGTVILDGVGGTGAVDSVAAQSGLAALSGNAGAVSPGSMAIPGQLALTGEAGTASAGTAAPESQVAATGVVATGTTGVVGIGSATFAGVSATASLGTLSAANITRKLRGNAATASLSPLLMSLAGDASRIRWVGHRVSVDGTDLAFGLSGPMTIDKSLDLGQQNTASFHVSDTAWPAAGNLWGNKSAEAYISLGTNPRQMTETKVFTGYTFQKRDAAGTPTETDLVCADASLAYTGIPVCYSLGAYSGKTRGQVITEVAATVGVTLTDVPAGGIINKPVTLNNADLLQWIADFGLVENWYPHVDRLGNLSVRVLNQPTAGWVLDAEKGDFDLDTLQETYPTRPPCRWYVTGSQAVQVVSTDDPESPEHITTTQVDEEQALYNPKCRKSYDPSGHSLPAAELMTVARITTEITTVGGDEVLRVTTTESFYNPETYDPNRNTWPPTSDYSEAYTDNSFHRDAVETLMETSKVTVTTTRDAVGTVLSQHTETMGWYSPQSNLTFALSYRPEQIVNGSGSLIYGDGKAHMTAEETYQIISEVDTTYEYDATQGTLLHQVSTLQGWTAPESPCDLVVYEVSGAVVSVRISNSMEETGYPPPYSIAYGDYSTWGDYNNPNGGIHTLLRRPYKWGEQDWRSQPSETFQMTKRVDTRYTVVDGQIVSTKETTEQFAKFESGPNSYPQTGADLLPFRPTPEQLAEYESNPGQFAASVQLNNPPFLFADGKWYEGPEAFELTGTKFTHYEKFGSTGHAKTTYSVDLMTGEVSVEAPTYSDGTMPLAPTIGSALRWARLPIVVEVEVAGCEFVDSKQNLDLPWAENIDDLNRAGLRAAQRATAAIREFDCALNPLVEPGDGLLLTSSEHGINAEWHVITDVKATVDAGADMHIIAERWAPV